MTIRRVEELDPDPAMRDTIFCSVSAPRHRLRGPLVRVTAAALAAFALVPELARAIG